MFVNVSLFFIIPVVFLVLFLLSSVKLVKQAEVIIVERLGKFDRILGPGIHMIIPFLESPRQATWTFTVQGDRQYYRISRTFYRIDLREAVYDFPKQNVITKDNVTMEINALLYYQITDVKAALYEVVNLPEAIEKLTQTTLRNVIGSLDLDESLVSRDAINERLRLILDEATDKWGVKVNRVELQEVNPPRDIREAMEKQMRAERDRRAIILESEGKKRAAILEAEGVKESKVLRASGEAESLVLAARAEAEARLLEAKAEGEAKIKIAHGEAEALKLVKETMPNADPAQYMVSLKYIEALPQMTKGHNNKLIVVPYESQSMMSNLASMKEMFTNLDASGK